MSLAALVMSVLMSGMVCSFWLGVVSRGGRTAAGPCVQGLAAVLEYNCIPNDIHLQAPRALPRAPVELPSRDPPSGALEAGGGATGVGSRAGEGRNWSRESLVPLPQAR